MNQPFFIKESHKDYIIVDVPENICVLEVDSDDSSHKCVSEMSHEVFDIVDQREKHLQNLFEAGDFIGDYVKDNNDVERASCKSEVFGGSVHNQSIGQINQNDYPKEIFKQE